MPERILPMPTNHHERIGKALELLRDGIAPFVAREFASEYEDQAEARALRLVPERARGAGPVGGWDEELLLRLLGEAWNDVFAKTLGRSERALVGELRDARERWARQEQFLADRAYRVLDSAGRLLTALAAPEAGAIQSLKLDLLRARFDEHARAEKRKGAGGAIAAPNSTLPPWREVVAPLKDVVSGRCQQAEFTADLWLVHAGEGADEYRRPAEFFRHTHLTGSLRRLLVGAARRLAGQDGDPVVLLQAGPGGGKTHGLLALYHLACGAAPGDAPLVEGLLQDAAVVKLPAVRRVVLAGNRISPDRPNPKPDGTVVRTLWGELAWQLGGRKAFQRIEVDDEAATLPPADLLRELLAEAGPCLILIDEWLAYARQLHDHGPLPAGTVQTQVAFAKALAEAVRSTPRCLLGIGLPAPIAADASADELDVGGERGRVALERLRAAVAPADTAWRPASLAEVTAIAQCRLFEPLVAPAHEVAREAVARSLGDLYRADPAAFPAGCGDAEYESRLRAAYPIHPEVFDRLASDWSTLARFDRTRGVLRFLAAVVHSLWQRGDDRPLILPGSLPLDDLRVQFELTRHLPEAWAEVIARDVDGVDAVPQRLDTETPTLGRSGACRRAARTVLFGSLAQAPRGSEDRRIALGCVQPGEAAALFAEALRRLRSAATHLYQEGTRSWFSLQPNVARFAEDRAAQLRRTPEVVTRELDQRIRADLRNTGDFSRVHALPDSGDAVSDDRDVRLVVIGLDCPYAPGTDSAADLAARAIWERRGQSPRVWRNTLVFLAADRAGLLELEDAARRFLAWQTIVGEQVELNLTPPQVKQAEAERAAADSLVTARIPGAYRWLLVPVQGGPEAPVVWQGCPLEGTEPLAVRASRKLRADGRLFATLSGTVLRAVLDQTVWQAGDHLPIQGLAERFAREPHLPRLREPAVLMAAIRDGLSHLAWARETFAYADSFDAGTGRYRGLRCGMASEPAESGLMVRSVVAQKQQAADVAAALKPAAVAAPSPPPPAPPPVAPAPPAAQASPTPPAPAPRMHRFRGRVVLDAARTQDLTRIAGEVLGYLVGNQGAQLTVTVDIDAFLPGGVPDIVARAVEESCRKLRFATQEFRPE